MKNKIKFSFAVIFLAMLMINLASAEIVFSQWKTDLGNGTIRNYMLGSYDKTLSQVANDYVKANNPYEVQINYRSYLKSWNEANPDYLVNYCNMEIQYDGSISNQSYVIYQENFSSSESDINSKDYYLRLYDTDSFTIDQKCYFANTSYNYLKMPVEVQAYTPTWECKACQYYRWVVLKKDVIKAQDLNGKVSVVAGYVKQIILLNFEILLALFWISLILMIFVSIGLIFLFIYYLYKYLSGVAK